MKHKIIITYKLVSATGGEFVRKFQTLLEEGRHTFYLPIIHLKTDKEGTQLCTQTVIMNKEDFDKSKYW